MVKLVWDQINNRTYELGVDRGVLYPSGKTGYAWAGLVSVQEIYTGIEADSKYFDGQKYRTYVGKGDFKLKVTSVGTPEALKRAEGIHEHGKGLYVTMQKKEMFGLTYRTLIGNDIRGEDYGYKIHIVYNCIATITGLSTSTITNDVPNVTKTWDLISVPYRAREYAYFRSGGDQTNIEYVKMVYNPVSHLVVDTQAVGPSGIRYLEETLYGTDKTDPHLPKPAEVLELIS